MEEQLRVEVLNGSGPVEVLLSGDIDLGTESRLTAVLADLAGRDVIVDLSAVGFIDSTGLTSLLTGHRAITDAGGTLMLRQALRDGCPAARGHRGRHRPQDHRLRADHPAPGPRATASGGGSGGRGQGC